MSAALELAKRGWGATHPNPMVGSLIVEDGRVVAEGWHAQDGGPHAERVALESLGRRPAPGAILYVTLEPCSTHGRTGACTEAILSSGIRHVVVGAADPNPAHAGKGIEVLRSAGIEVISGVIEAACLDLNLIYNHWIAKGSPLFAGKAAVTLDGRIACRSGQSKWITGEPARADVHRWRRLFPGIAVGAMTVLKDNPRLTARRDGEEWCPRRFIFDGLLRTVTDRNLPRVYTDEFHDRTIVVATAHGGLGYARKLREAGVQVWIFDSPNQRVPLQAFRERCRAEGIGGVYFEGGTQLVSELIGSRQMDYLFVYRAPLLLADDKALTLFRGLRTDSLEQAVRMVNVRHAVLGDDELMRGAVVYPKELQVDETAFGRGWAETPQA